MFRIKDTWLTLAILGLLILLPIFIANPYILHIIILALLYSIMTTAYDLASGHGGIATFGQQAFLAIGGYTSALVSMYLGISPWLCLFISGFTAMIFGFLIGLPCLRLKGSYVSLITLAFGFITELVLTNWIELTRGPMGLWGIPSFSTIQAGSIKISFEMADKVNYYYLALVITLIILFIKYKLVKSNFGLAITSIKESQTAAESLGINSTKYKLLTLAISAFITGIAGSIYAHYIGLLVPNLSGISIMIMILVMTSVGGHATLLGPVIGAFVLTFLSEILRFLGPGRFVIYGVFIILSIFFLPGGLASLKDKFKLYL